MRDVAAARLAAAMLANQSEASGWPGMAAPLQHTDRDRREAQSRDNAGLATPKINARLAELDDGAFVTSPVELGKFTANETDTWAGVVKFSRIKLD